MNSNCEDTEPVLELGFLEPHTEPWKLTSRFFRSKVGGLPPWLVFKDLPTDLDCGVCGKRLLFLLQVYAPVEDDPLAFHRSILVFMCATPSCHSSPAFESIFRVYRSQLPRSNPFYPYDPPTESPQCPPELLQERVVPLCRLCGAGSANKSCSGCKKAKYCSKEHQTIDWKRGEHRSECSKDDIPLISPYATSYLLPEYELLMESDDEIVSDDEEEEDDETPNVDGEIAKAEALSNKELSAEEVAKALASSEATVDKVFNKFRKNVKMDPTQVLRYYRGREPLWISSEGRSSSIPDCNICGSPRTFEFQIMPQMIGYLKLAEGNLGEDSVDWGILGIYTCSNSCDGGSTYKSEYLFRQNPSSSSSVN